MTSQSRNFNQVSVSTTSLVVCDTSVGSGWKNGCKPSVKNSLHEELLSGLLVLLQPLRWFCVDCVIHHERDVREEQHHIYMWCEQAIRVIVAWKLCRY